MNDLSSDLASLRIDRSPPPTRRRGVPGWLFGLVGVGALVAAGAVAVPRVTARMFKTEVQATEIAMISPSQASVDLTSTGYVQAETVAKVGSKIVGRIMVANVREGETVKAGQVLYELDPVDQKAALAAARAKAGAASARANAAKARAAVTKASLAETDALLKRQKLLAEKNAASANTVEDIELKRAGLVAQVGVSEAEASAALAEASSAYADAQVYATNLGSLTITSPIDGIATGRAAAVGDVASPEKPLVEIADFSTLVIETDVPEARLGLVKPGGPCEVVLDAFSDKRLPATVLRVLPKLNRSKATGAVQVKLDAPMPGMLPEMAARVSFLQKKLADEETKRPAKKVVPASAVVDRAGVKNVFVLDGGKVRLVPVQVGEAVGGGLELREGPPPGTRVVKSPAPELTDGQAVKEGSA